MTLTIEYETNGTIKQTSGSGNGDISAEITVSGNRTKVTVSAKRDLRLLSAKLSEPYDYAPDCRIFVNGYQSWTDTREFRLPEGLHTVLDKPEVVRYKSHYAGHGDERFHKYRRGCLHGYTYGYVRQASGGAELFGSYNEENAWLVTVFDKRHHKLILESDCDGRDIRAGEEFTLYDFIRLKGRLTEVSREYFSGFGKCEREPIRGYTSWYLHYQNIDLEKMNTALEQLDPENYDLFQIDDGYQTYVGDWMDVDGWKFPEGLDELVEKIHAKGLLAGLWLSPFLCEKESRIHKLHPEWIYRENNEEVLAGNNWSGAVILDIRKQEVRDYIKECLTFYSKMGFDLFKLDFLYAAALIHENTGITRAEMMRGAMKFLRECLPDKLILGCGVPLSAAFGLVDYCRIGTDVSLKFDDEPYMRLMHRERVSTKRCLVNTIFRSFMDGYVFRNDPDVYLLRDKDIELSKEQRRALVMLNHLFGAVYMTSDNVGEYNEEKKQMLAEAQKLTAAEVKDIAMNGKIVRIEYVLDGKEEVLFYDTAKGVLADKDPFEV